MEGEAGHPGSGAALDSGNPLLKAVFLRRLRLTRLLLEGGAYINESDGKGQTPLMVACRTQHNDTQSASRVKLVQFLLEKGADPNIQDKEGRSALMHACREQAGPEVASLLLASGANVSLEDQSGTSALVYAVTAGDWTVLKLLLDTCKANGKEVIIIATDQFPCGKLQAQQGLSVPPVGAESASQAPASPSEIQLITSPQCTSSLCPPNTVFSFKEGQTGGLSSHPCSPSRFQRLGQAAPNGLQQLLRLNSEPWLKIPASTLGQQLHISPSSEHSSRADDVPLRIPKLGTSNSTTEGFKWYERQSARDKGPMDDGQKISIPGLLSSHSASHPNLNCPNLATDSLNASASFSGSKSLHSMASSSLHSIIQRRKLGADIYNSDPQLARDVHHLPEESRRELTEAKRLAPLRCSSTLGSGDAPPASGPNRTVLPGYERRGSGAYLLDHMSQTRPRSLPPLSLSSTNAPTLYNLKGFLPSAPPGHPKELTKRMLMRRHSMQTEQFKTTA